jgi:putative phosphoesterase
MAGQRIIPASFQIGLISDTHGLLRPEALAALQGADHIIHAGDIGKPFIIQELARIAPLTAVRGNNDTGEWARDLPDAVSIDLAGVHIHVLHDVKELGKYPPPANAQVIIAGHSHQPLIRSEADTLHVNPGSAGPRRFRLPVTLGWMEIRDGRPHAEIIRLL